MHRLKYEKKLSNLGGSPFTLYNTILKIYRIIKKY